MKASEILEHAQALLMLEGAWTQGCAARDIIGRETRMSLGDATSWCALGAIEAVTSGHAEFAYAELYLRQAIGGGNVFDFNDSPYTTKDDILIAFERAIRIAKDYGQ